MLKINLNEEEANFLSDFKEELFKVTEFSFRIINDDHDSYTSEIHEDDASAIRDFCGGKLQIFGFDADYNLTEQGEILEELIDKLFI